MLYNSWSCLTTKLGLFAHAPFCYSFVSILIMGTAFNGSDILLFFCSLCFEVFLSSWPSSLQWMTEVNQGWEIKASLGVSHMLPYGSLRRKLRAGFTYMIVPRGRYYMTHCIVKKNGGINKWSSFSKITQLWMGRDEVWMQVVLIPKAMLFRACISYYSLNEDDFSGHYARFFFFLINKKDVLLFCTNCFLQYCS